MEETYYQLIAMGVIAASGICISSSLGNKRRKFLDYFYNQRVPELVALAEGVGSEIDKNFQNLINKINDTEKGRR